MVVTQVIPALVRGAVAQQRLEDFCRGIVRSNQDIKAAKDVLIKGGTKDDLAALQVVKRNPDIEAKIRRDSWDLE
jgi:hypothetical protein